MNTLLFCSALRINTERKNILISLYHAHTPHMLTLTHTHTYTLLAVSEIPFSFFFFFPFEKVSCDSLAATDMPI